MRFCNIKASSYLSFPNHKDCCSPETSIIIVNDVMIYEDI